MSTPFELNHGRIEQRLARCLRINPLEVCFPCVRSVVEVRRNSRGKKSGAATKGRRLFLSDVDDVTALEELGKLRLRWNVENKNHHPRDATLLEDKCRCRTGNTSANLAILRGAVLTLWKKTRPKTPAPAFIAKNQRNLDALIALTNKNQRLRKLQ